MVISKQFVCPEYNKPCVISVNYIDLSDLSSREFYKGDPSCSLEEHGIRCNHTCNFSEMLPEVIRK